MALVVASLLLNSLTADPGSPVDGLIWYRSDDDEVKARINGVTRVLATEAQLANYLLRDGSNAMTAALDFGNQKGVNVATPTAAGDAAEYSWTLDQITSKLQGLDFQESVIDKDLTAPPGGEATGDRYIVGAGATGDWAGHDDEIAEWDGAAYVYSVPNEGFTTRVMDENKIYMHDGTSWGLWDAVVDHGSLLGLGDDDHTQYLLASGARAMAGNLNMGTNNITNVGTVDGVTVSGHAARHQNGGADEISVAGLSGELADPQPVTIRKNSGANVGTRSRLNLIEGTGVTMTIADDAGDDEVDITINSSGGGTTPKSGLRAAANFSGTPMTSTVTFATAFGDNNYSVSVVLECQNNANYPCHIHTKSASGFVIELGSNDKTDLLNAHWIATPHSDP